MKTQPVIEQLRRDRARLLGRQVVQPHTAPEKTIRERVCAISTLGLNAEHIPNDPCSEPVAHPSLACYVVAVTMAVSEREWRSASRASAVHRHRRTQCDS